MTVIGTLYLCYVEHCPLSEINFIYTTYQELASYVDVEGIIHKGDGKRT
jgi:hypothetical protein